MSEHRVIGGSQRRIDVADKVTGRARYTDDLVLPRMLHCKILRSRVPHAELVKVDVSAALEVPGVLAAITGEDLKVPYGILPVSQDEHALCRDRVRFVGDPVAAVAAEDEETASAALARIAVELRPLEPVGSIEDALARPEPRLHAYAQLGNIHRMVSQEFGDLEQGLAEADYVREDSFFYGGSTHLALEQHAALADWSPDGRLTLWSSTQTPHYVHRVLARVLELPAARVRVIVPALGGGFGGKTDPFNHELVVAKLAMRTGRPVKICLTREEVFYCHRGRHPTRIWMKTGVKKDGAITGMHVKTVLDGGAYGSYGVASTLYTGALQTVTYRVPHYRFDGARVFTNKPPCGPKRGHGTPQGRFALEVQLDKIAEALGLDPADLRLRHLVAPNSLTANYLRIGSTGLRQCLETVVERSGWRQKHGQLPFGRGVGLACSSYLSGAGVAIYWNQMPHSGVMLKLDRGGGVTVYCGSTDVGQGSDSVLAFVVAEVLGIAPGDVRVFTADTDLTPVDLGSYSSRVTLMTGNAALQAAERARELLASAVAGKLEAGPEELVFAEGRVFRASDPDTGVSFAEAVVAAESRFGTLATVGHYAPLAPAGQFKGSGVGPSPAYSYTAAVAEVSVDPETGIVRAEKVWIAHDVGRAIHRPSVVGQIEGSVYMGLGEALFEETSHRAAHNLVPVAPSMLGYKSPTALDMCEVESFVIEDPDPQGPFGAKEVGQGPLLPIPPAIVNAIHDAVGVRIDEVPVTPDKVLRALLAREQGREPRVGPGPFPDLPWPDTVRVLPPWETESAQAPVGKEKA
jgi:4-hydroxybenzoyl-CoA reductase alpha subunit